MSNLLSIASHKSKYSLGFYPTFAVDGVPLEVWLPQHNREAELHLVSAHSGLNDDDDTYLVWDRIYSTAPGWDTLVPLLVCSDDLDLTCTVIVAEQHADEHHVQWRRFGLLRDLITLQSPAADWYDSIPSLTFERSHFESVLDAFRKQENIKMDWD
ncbi:hypothetical protein N5F23_21650 [Pseudomonas sichuanensis]|uniref:hypothetical protein n=1 Tax=Pseudomonas sichuanensis TaxID=2213015 RepID=UPI00244A2A75|nr:hypothetical protein [Pseudomonas sichuanensis]MDH0732379.1 hypothetical protein [Pseudomonas sichuanensis]MDH1585195.1 hypothetical protein [Pseudomonas sichuanensis]MDH1595608.1 hypothetical protein [Pseudomonas sichuanensis]MDH1599764.1 hypothetical protein [Pseudomonas sichuanensis]